MQGSPRELAAAAAECYKENDRHGGSQYVRELEAMRLSPRRISELLRKEGLEAQNLIPPPQPARVSKADAR